MHKAAKRLTPFACRVSAAAIGVCLCTPLSDVPVPWARRSPACIHVCPAHWQPVVSGRGWAHKVWVWLRSRLCAGSSPPCLMLLSSSCGGQAARVIVLLREPCGGVWVCKGSKEDAPSDGRTGGAERLIWIQACHSPPAFAAAQPRRTTLQVQPQT